MLTAYFYHKTTGVPLTDPLVTVSVTLANMNNDTKVLDNASMSPSSAFPWAYRNSYAIDKEIDYMAYYSCSDSSYITSVDKLYIPSSSVWGGWGSINISGIQTSIRNSRDSIVEEIGKFTESFKSQFNETNSYIEIAKEEINDKIESIEIPEAILEEKEAKKALKIVTSIDKKLSGYIESEMEKEDDNSKEFIKQQIDEIMKDKKEKEEAKMKEEEEDKKILEEIKAEFDKQDEEEKAEKKKELEKELEETLKEAEEIKKELKTL